MPQVTVDFTPERWAAMKESLAQAEDDTDAKKDARVSAWITSNAHTHADQCVQAKRDRRLGAIDISARGLSDDQVAMLEADVAAKAAAAVVEPG